jgi:hypothetical protein
VGKNKEKVLAAGIWTSSFNFKVLKKAEDYIHSGSWTENVTQLMSQFLPPCATHYKET